jgi:hypothetical protein
MNSRTVKFSYKLSEREFFFGSIISTYSTVAMKVGLVLSIFDILMSILVFTFNESTTFTLPMMTGALFFPMMFLVILPTIIYFRCHKIYKNVPAVSEEYICTLSPAEFSISSASSSVAFKISEFIKVKIYKSIVLLWFSKYQIIILPMKALNGVILKQILSLKPAQ